MDKEQKKKVMPVWLSLNWKKAMPMLAVAVGVVLLCFIGGLAAKYVVIDKQNDNQISANDFYFTMDVLTATDQNSGKDENTITERTIPLYGSSQASFSFQVRNYLDDLRINAKDITYTISYTADPGVDARLTLGGANVASGTAYTLTAGAKDADEFLLSAPDNAVEGGKITVTVKSSTPYEKEMKLTVILYPQQYDVLYRVEDAAGDPYARLIIMVGKEGGVAAGKINLDWSAANGSANALQVDSTNTFVNFSGTHSGLTEGAIPYVKSAVSTEAVAESGSVAVYFFKADPSKNYSVPDTIVEADNSGVYQVVFGTAAN